MSFADYSADSKTMADLSTQLVSIQQSLNNSYNELVPTWQGDAAANFEAKMAVFFKAAGTVTQDVATTGKDVAALVARPAAARPGQGADGQRAVRRRAAQRHRRRDGAVAGERSRRATATCG